jgi:predicted enzyme related to lactoylglutathione lyase
MMTRFASLCWMDIECADPNVLGEFYRQVLGWEITHYRDEAAVITDGHTSFRFGRVDGYEPPAWPESATSKRFHLDLEVEDVPAAVQRCLELGASQPSAQPGGARWTVLLDPAGHPFCLCPAPADN